MPYCPKCGRFYYATVRSCATCGELLTARDERPASPGSDFRSIRKPEKEKRCPYCNSTGTIKSSQSLGRTETCPVCRGRRFNLVREDAAWCRECDGTGEFIYGSRHAEFRKPCPECTGTGWIKPRD